MKLLFDESLSPKLVDLLGDLFPDSESAVRNGLAGCGDVKILEYAIDHDFILVSTDMDFAGLAGRFRKARIVILRSCNYPTVIASELLRRNAIRIGEPGKSPNPLLILDR